METTNSNFVQVTQRFDRIEGRLEGLQTDTTARFNEVDNRLDALSSEVGEIREHFARPQWRKWIMTDTPEQPSRLDRIESILLQTVQAQQANTQAITQLGEKIDRLASSVLIIGNFNAHHTESRHEIYKCASKINKQVFLEKYVKNLEKLKLKSFARQGLTAIKLLLLCHYNDFSSLEVCKDDTLSTSVFIKLRLTYT
ncbi:MAG: hypothetical protein KME55_34840 [Nostoc indistinguendum CM1-VF10]|nr:hypothetical protein [Nostoc indistinguendum CM1-VF10]